MTVRSVFIVLAALALSVAVAPAVATDLAAEIRVQVREIQRIHERDGMVGLEASSRACWAGAGGFRCLHMDVAAGTLDREFAGAMGIGGYPYFAVDPLLQRARPLFAHARWDMKTSNTYLQFLDGVVRGELGTTAP